MAIIHALMPALVLGKLTRRAIGGMAPLSERFSDRLSDAQLIKTPVEHGFDHLGGLAVSFEVATDGVSKVAAVRVE